MLELPCKDVGSIRYFKVRSEKVLRKDEERRRRKTTPGSYVVPDHM